MNKTKLIELLAPAKDKECAFAAIDGGADAVYIGYEKFGARANASNSIEEIKEVIDYAHKFRAKVYITLNTLLKDKEIEEAALTVQNLYKNGADAIIIQDMGLLEYDLPPVAIHASTQCHNNTLEKVQFLEKTGFKRAVLARELSLNEISDISNNTNIELECFIHGALCVSYSGQCYMSYANGGRSANRGTCAQPCRKKYAFIDSENYVIEEDSHLLCLKDFNLSKDLENLMDAGITSFKIEGRLKDANYVKNVVSFYNEKINNIIERTDFKRSSQGASFIDFTPELNKTFNRDYTDYFLNGRSKAITSFASPNFKGEYVGQVKSVGAKSFTVDGLKLNNNDGICFYEGEELKGIQATKVVGAEVFPFESSMESFYVGQKIYRNYDHEFIKKLEKSTPKRKLKVQISITESDDDLFFEMEDEEKNKAVIQIKNDFEPANNKDSARQNLEKQLLKLGDSDFIANNADIKIKNLPFIPISQLNSIRRELCEKLSKERIQNFTREDFQMTKNDEPYPEKELFFSSNIINEKAKQFYERHQSTVLEQGAEIGINLKDKVIMTTKHCLKHSFDLCPKQTKQNKNTFKEPFFLMDEKNNRHKLEFDCQNCVMKIYY